MVDNDCMLSFIGRLKRHYDEGGEKAIIELSDVILNEDSECSFYESIYYSEFLISTEFNDDTYYSRYFFSSEKMTEYYRLAKKIGRLMGWSYKENKYRERATSYTIRRLNKIDTSGGACYGNVYSGTKHRYASSVNVYVYEECGFYDYEGLYFAIIDIFDYYEKQLKILKKIYAGIIAISLSLLLPQELEVAA